jgi:hypothetical protein
VEPDPLSCVGLLVYLDEETMSQSILGTCAAFRQPHVALTAAHTLSAVKKPTRIRIEYPRRGLFYRVTNVKMHNSADLAILFSPSDEVDDLRGPPPGAFSNFVANWGLGEDFYAYGFPIEGPGRSPVGQTPTPRLFKGSYQRFFEFDAPGGYRYLAGELSIPAPAGLSGGPLFRPEAPSLLTGIVTMNTEAYSTEDWYEETTGEGTARVEAHHRVIRYGVGVMLSPLSDWLDEFVQHRVGTAWNPER